MHISWGVTFRCQAITCTNAIMRLIRATAWPTRGKITQCPQIFIPGPIFLKFGTHNNDDQVKLAEIGISNYNGVHSRK